MSQYKEDTEAFIITKQSSVVNGETKENLALEEVTDYIYAGDMTLNSTYKERLVNARNLILSVTGIEIENIEWDKITKIEQKAYKERLAVEAGKMIWFADSEQDQEAKWCLDLGIQVFVKGKGFLADSGSYIVGSTGEYGNTIGSGYETVSSGVYCCSPDLKDSFNTGCTYYLVYDSVDSNPKIGDPIYKNAPSGWYDYGNKKWANIVTASNGHLAYFTWIPRYMFKTEDGQVTKLDDKNLDVKFVDLDNNYTGTDGVKKTEEELKSDGYVLPDAFEFGGKKLSGIWVGKYEISDPKEAVGFLTSSTDSSITVESLTMEGQSSAEVESEDPTKNDVTVTINGNTETGKLPITIDGLAPNTNYKVTVTIPTNYLEDLVLTKEVRTTEESVNDIAAPDLTGFNKENTYFVTYANDKDTEGTIGDKIQTKNDDILNSKSVASNSPSGWYDYENKKWANIVTLKETGEAAYWTWIPRYEYKIDNKLKSVDVVFIKGNQTTPDEGYQIPDAFKFNNKELSGIWVGKYEITDVAIPTGFTVGAIDGGFTVSSICYDGSCKKTSGMPNSGTMRIKKKDNSSVVKTQAVKVGDKITNLDTGVYEVEWDIPLSYNNASKTQQTKTVKEEVTVKSSITVEKPDLSGFKDKSESYVYYVEYGNNLNSADEMKVGDKVQFGTNGEVTNAPSNWYDYSLKKWANIIVSTEELTKETVINYSNLYNKKNITMWVWIPKYEYKIDKNSKSISTIFIGKNDNSPDRGYSIPDAFKFGDTDLSGIWVGKYEIANSGQ